MAAATSSLPAPVSPRSSTGTCRSATRMISARSACIAALSPSRPSLGCGGHSSITCSSSTTVSASSSTTPPRTCASVSSHRPCTAAPSTSSALPSAGTSRSTDAPGPPRSSIGLRLRSGLASASLRAPSAVRNTGSARESTRLLPESRSNSGHTSPTRDGSGWCAMVKHTDVNRIGPGRLSRGLMVAESSAETMAAQLTRPASSAQSGS